MAYIFDPPPTLDVYRVWDRTATRPLTQGAIGTASAARRNRCARLSSLWLRQSTIDRALEEHYRRRKNESVGSPVALTSGTSGPA